MKVYIALFFNYTRHAINWFNYGHVTCFSQEGNLTTLPKCARDVDVIG